MAPAATAPGKIILLGEHAVVYGEPAVAAALDLRSRVAAAPAAGESHTVNGHALNAHHHAHLVAALESVPTAGHVAFEAKGGVPSGAGLGSSAALSVAAVACLLALRGSAPKEEEIARAAYETEWRAQGGRGSPTDTSTVAHGGGILVAPEPGTGLLWTVERGERRWHLHDVKLPPLRVVVGNTGERGRTAEQVAKVARVTARGGFGRGVVRDLGATARAGIAALAAADLRALGREMDRAHNLLTMLGVSTDRLDRYCEAARKAGAVGAKLTGSGGGGCMIALVERDPDPVVAAMRKAGCREPIVATLGGPGVVLE